MNCSYKVGNFIFRCGTNTESIVSINEKMNAATVFKPLFPKKSPNHSNIEEI